MSWAAFDVCRRVSFSDNQVVGTSGGGSQGIIHVASSCLSTFLNNVIDVEMEASELALGRVEGAPVLAAGNQGGDQWDIGADEYNP